MTSRFVSRILLGGMALGLTGLHGCTLVGAFHAFSMAELDRHGVSLDGLVRGYPYQDPLPGAEVKAIELDTGELRGTTTADAQGHYHLDLRVRQGGGPWIVQALQPGPHLLMAAVWPSNNALSQDVTPGDTIATGALLQLAAGSPQASIFDLDALQRRKLLDDLSWLDKNRYVNGVGKLNRGLVNPNNLTGLGPGGLEALTGQIAAIVVQNRFQTLAMDSRIEKVSALPAVMLDQAIDSVSTELDHSKTLSDALTLGAENLDLGAVVSSADQALETPGKQGGVTLLVDVSKLSLDPASNALPGLLNSLQVEVEGDHLTPIVGVFPRRYLSYDPTTHQMKLHLIGINAGHVSIDLLALDSNNQGFSSAHEEGVVTVGGDSAIATSLVLPANGLAVDLGPFPAVTVSQS